MKLAYLVNQYPHISHTFIRREIAALVGMGLEVRRFSIRRPPVDLADPADCEEQQQTRPILAAGLGALALAALRRALTRPAAFARALALAISAGRRSDRGVLRHLVYLAEAAWLADELRQLDTDHLHAHFGTNSATVAMLCHALGGPSYSFTVHGPEEFDRPEMLSLRQKIERAEFVVAISEFGRSQLYRWCGHEHWSRIHVVRCGVDAGFLNGSVLPMSAVPRLVCVGRLCEQKGQLLLIQAAAALAAEGRDLEIVLVGDGPMRGEIERLIRELGMDKHIRLTGWMSGQQVRDEILASRAMVLPSFAEGLPVVLMESLALGRPVISTYVAGIPELVQPGINGWLVPAGSVEALVGAMRDALTCPAERLEEMGREGARRVLERHSASTEAARLAELFRGTIAGHGNRELRAVRSTVECEAAPVQP